jgi:Phage integrase, N-terminal SAM-like domain
VDRGLVFDAENLALAEYLDRWLSGSVRGSVKQSTFDRNVIAIRVHIKPALGRIKLKKLAPAHVQGFYQDRLDAGSAPASVNKLHVVLHKALDQAVRWHISHAIPPRWSGHQGPHLKRCTRSQQTRHASCSRLRAATSTKPSTC